jgi:hypothetical protein
MILSGQISFGEKVLFTSLANHETPQPAGALPAYGFDGLVLSQFDGGSAEAAISILQELARAQAFGARRVQEARTHRRCYESSSPLRKLPPSPWRSLGGYFDYDHWADRERFVELDRAIAASQQSRMFELETDGEIF